MSVCVCECEKEIHAVGPAPEMQILYVRKPMMEK